MRNCRKYCKHSPEIGDLILSNGLSYNVLEYKKLINPRAIVNVRGSIKEEDALPGDYILDIGIYVPADVYEIVKDILPGEEIINPMAIITYEASAKLDKTWSNESAIFGTTIKSHTFENGVGTIEFNADVTSIGNGAFYGCSGLTSITIPDSVTSINMSAFQNCSGLTSITIPNSVTSIGGYAFGGCSNLSSVTLNSNTILSLYSLSNTFGNQVTEYIIGDNITNIGVGAFQNCIGLISITIPDSVTSIGDSAFHNCSCLTSIEIPNSVTSIGSSAFSSCTGLTSVTIGSGVTSIGEQAFDSCSNLFTITSHIMNSPSVNNSTFYGAKKDGTLYVPIGSSGYETWMNNYGNLGLYNWTKVEQ